MCGIVFAGSSSFLSSNEIGFFETMLYMDVIRGMHGTGVIAGYNIADKKENYAISAKTADPASVFLSSKAWVDVSKQSYKNQHNTEISKTPYFLVGHNRHATCGAKTAENAHPFTHGDITLVHNGTLRNQSLLPEHSKFEVDSNNICYSINQIGAAETIQKLNGAYTLIWFDNKEKTLNIIRNSERPFHLAKTASGTWYGASEEEMLMWILQRDDKYSLTKSSPKISEHFECEEGIQYVFDVKDGKFEPKLLKDEGGKIIPDSWKIKHELPTFRTQSYNGGYGGRYAYLYGDDDYGYDYSRYASRSSVNQSKVNYNNNIRKSGDALLSECKLNKKIGDRIWFEALSFEPYSGKPTQGKLCGWIEDADEYIEVQNHVFDADKFSMNRRLTGEIISAYRLNGTAIIIVKDSQETLLKKDNSVPLIEPPRDSEDEEAFHVLMEDNELFSREDWDNSSQSICANCNVQIHFDEAEYARAVLSGYICFSCSEEFEKEALMEDKEDDAPFRTTFGCTMCGRTKNCEEESLQTGICDPCYESFYKFEDQVYEASVPRTVLDDGSEVTEKEWKSMNTCIQCNERVDFTQAHMCSVRTLGILCFDCCL